VKDEFLYCRRLCHCHWHFGHYPFSQIKNTKTFRMLDLP